jgi:hypothetical protein
VGTDLSLTLFASWFSSGFFFSVSLPLPVAAAFSSTGSVGAWARVFCTAPCALDNFWCRSVSCETAYARFCEESQLPSGESEAAGRTETSGDWLRVLTQYLFQRRPSSSASSADVKTWTSSG